MVGLRREPLEGTEGFAQESVDSYSRGAEGLRIGPGHETRRCGTRFLSRPAAREGEWLVRVSAVPRHVMDTAGERQLGQVVEASIAIGKPLGVEPHDDQHGLL